MPVAETIHLELDLTEELAQFRLPDGVHQRLQRLLDRQDSGIELTPEERKEAEGLVDLAEFLSLLRMRAERLSSGSPHAR
jgi:hypothetical protein